MLHRVLLSLVYIVATTSCYASPYEAPAGGLVSIRDSEGTTPAMNSEAEQVSLSSALESVLAALPAALPQETVESFKQIVQGNATELDTLTPPSSEKVEARSISTVDLACQANRLLFGSRVVLPRDSQYAEEQSGSWSSTCHLPAACFLQLQNTVEVALALAVVKLFRTPFVVRSGGHNPNPGFSSVGQNGIMLDLAKVNDIVIAPGRDAVTIGAGATWDQVYTAVEKQGLTVAGGRVAGIGVGGLLLGGGMSHFTNHYGLAADHVRNFEVVLSDSRVVNANARTNPDLFKALKAGGPNFGIVTRVELNAFADNEHKLWYEFRTYSAADSARVMAAAVEVQAQMERDDRVGFFLSVDANYFVAGMLFRGKGLPPPPAVFAAFDKIPAMAIALPATNGTMASATLATAVAGESKRAISNLTIRTDAALYQELHRLLQKLAVPPAFTLQFTFQPVGPAAARVSSQRSGGNFANIPAASQSWLGILISWADGDDATAQGLIDKFVASASSAARARNQLLDFRFMNDCGIKQNPLRSYGTASLDNLKAVARKYDASEVFQVLQNDGFLLSSA